MRRHRRAVGRLHTWSTALIRLSSAAALVSTILWCGPVQAAPLVRSLNVRGLQIGGTTTLVLEGAGLLPTRAW